MSKMDIALFCRIITGRFVLSELAPQQWTELLLILRETRLLASFAWKVSHADMQSVVPEFFRRHLLSAKVHAGRQAQQVRFESDKIQQALASCDVQPIFLKGANYVLRQSDNARGRVFSDIDILVPKDKLQQVEKALKKKGWKSETLTAYDEKYYRQWSHEIPPMYHPLRQTVLDIHHNLYLPISGRAPDIVRFTESPTQVGELLVLSPVATVMHSIIHLYMNEDFSNAFRDLYDLHLLFAEYANDDFWSALLTLAKHSGFGFELAACIRAQQHYFELPIPAQLESLIEGFNFAVGDNLWLNHLFILAAAPNHPLLQTGRHDLARNLVYLRGHWQKMPLPVLCKHFALKSWLAIAEAVLGKYSLKKH